jgi:hypothetical protein
MDEVFYMLFVEGRSTPTRKHATITEAQVEATRLIANTGKPVYILKGVGKYELKPQPVVYTSLIGS